MANLINGKIRNARRKPAGIRYRWHLSFAGLVSLGVVIIVSFAISRDAAPHKGIERKQPVFRKREIVSIKVGDRDTFYDLMSKAGIPSPDILKMAKASKKYYDMRKIKKGTTINLLKLDGEIITVEYRYGDIQKLVLQKRESSGPLYSAKRVELPHTVVAALHTGAIDNTLYESAVKAGLDPDMIISLSDIFAWDIDFATDIRKGDTFKVLHEEILVNGKQVNSGRILAARLINRGKEYTAIYFRDKKGRAGYFDLQGHSLSRQLLKSPLRYRRISSYFTNRRFHPILKIYRPHHGIDYAAPRGTPIEAAGKGTVIYAGWKRGYGRFVMIRHNGDYSTGYGHMSKIARGIRRGKKVTQGQIIGYVGSTGISTGPHLHYEIKVRGRLVNPLAVKLPPSGSVRRSEMGRFKAVREAFLLKMSPDNSRGVAQRMIGEDMTG